MIKQLARTIVYSIPSSALLLFHHITDSPTVCRSGCVLSYDKFTGIIEKYSQYADLNSVVKKPSEKQIAITFDDGLLDVYEIAYPFLKERNIPFTIFVITDFLDTPGYITKDHLKKMASDSLVTIGSHGVTHKNINSLSPSEQKYELNHSKEYIEEIIGKPVNSFAFSHGQYDKSSVKLMKNYRYGFTVDSYPLNFITARNLKLLPRINVDNNSFDSTCLKLSKIFKGIEK